MKKLSPTQIRTLDRLTHTLEVIRKYNDFADFFDNSINEQSQFPTASRCNIYFNSSEKYKNQAPNEWDELCKAFEKAKNDSILIVYAKTETIKALEKAGKIQIVEAAQYKGDAETVKVL